MAKVLVCVAWPYSNSAIHLGHVAGSLLPPDIFTKFLTLKGDEVLMVSGSDQHGTPVTVTAEREGTTPEEVAERYHRINKKAIEDLGIEFSLFTKTHTKNHFEVVEEIFLTLLNKGLLVKKGTMQYYCPQCAKFLPDRYVVGTCSQCSSEKSRGDQCESCGTTHEPGDLIGARCTNCATTPELKETEHFFLRLSEFEAPLLQYVANKDYWRPSVQLFTQNWLQAGLIDRAVTRDMSWGVPVPVPGYEDKVIYVWFEAVIGYLSASKEWAKIIGRPDAWKEYWTQPEVRSYYFLGKDNIPFHTIIWPAILMGYGGLNLPYDVPANEWLTFKGEKFSKSRGVGVDVPSFLKKFDSDLVRYYLTVNMPEGKDADFSWEDFDAKINNELVATLGNYYHRVLSFTQKNFGSVPTLPMEGTEKERQEVYDAIIACKVDVDTHISSCQFKKALKAVMDLAQFGNRFFDAVAPWALVKSDKERCGAMLHLNLEIVKALAIMSYPFLPRSANEVWEMMGQEGRIGKGSWRLIDAALEPSQMLKVPRPMFNKIVMEKEESPFHEFSKLNLKVAKVIDVTDHPNADKLYVLRLDAGKEMQLVAGLKTYYSKEQLLGKKIVYISNLQPAKLRGVESQGMMLAAESDGKVFVLTPGEGAEPGEPVSSGMPQGEKLLSFQDFQRFIIRTGHVTGEGEVDLGQPVKVKFPPGVKVPGQVAVFLPSPDAKEGLPLFTAKGTIITVDGELGNGAQVR